MPNLTEILKQAAVEAVEASEPAGVVFGTVKTVNPLTVEIDQKTVLSEEFFLLTSNVRTHKVSMTVNHDTGYTSGGEGEESFATHKHSYSGTKNYIVNNGLSVGDKVLLLRQQGGQFYIILDRMEV